MSRLVRSASNEELLTKGLEAGGAVRMWKRIVADALPAMRKGVPAGSRVLEVGFGDGLLSCWLARELGWRITGLDIRPGVLDAARLAGREWGVEDQVEFHVCEANATRDHEGAYDAVFIKTVLYSSASLSEYVAWLDWIRGVMRPGGVLVNFETGRANGFVQAYRRFRRRPYTDQSLYTKTIEQLYDDRFEPMFRGYYAGLSQFVAPIPGLGSIAASLEAALFTRTADNCFAVATVARKR